MKNLWVPLSGALAQQKKVEIIANNVANANTPGYKRDEIIFEEYLTALNKGDGIRIPQKEWSPGDFYQTHGVEKSQVKIAGTYTDFANGQLKSTGNPFDIALNGSGFFEILTPNGIRYTRRGTFTTSSEGKLVTPQGDPVLSKWEVPSATPEGTLSRFIAQAPVAKERAIVIPKGKFSVNMQGEIFVDGKKLSDLSIVEFKDSHTLKKEGNSYFFNEDAKNILPGSVKTKVHQGFLEGSNVNAITEMSELIKAHRHFESIQSAIKAYDNIAGKSVNESTLR